MSKIYADQRGRNDENFVSSYLDPNTRFDVKILLEQVSSGCRLCLLRNLPHENMVALILIDEDRGQEFRQSYCQACYDYLRVEARHDIKNMPPFSHVTLDPVIIQAPFYVVKKGDPLKLFFPEDPIDLGLLRQHRSRERINRLPK